MAQGKQKCLQELAAFEKSYGKLKEFLAEELQLKVKYPAFSDKPCAKRITLKRTLRSIQSYRNDHSARIGALLPLTGPYKQKSTWVTNGIRSLYPYRNISYKSRVLLRDTVGSTYSLRRHLAELILHHRVSIILGGFTKAEARELRYWAQLLQFPTLILSKPHYKARVLEQVFYTSPTANPIARMIAQQAATKGFKKIAYLEPQGQHQGFMNQLHKHFATHNIQLTEPLHYQPNNYNSLESTVRKLVQVNTGNRHSEHQKELVDAAQKAIQVGTAFKKSQVSLAPILDVDAIIINDHFRNVRHLTKIFRFLGVEKVQLIGTPLWRALGLIDPPEPMLDGAIFADMIGSYRQIPKAITAPTAGSAYVLEPGHSDRVDYMLLGYHSAKIADRCLSRPVMGRSVLYKRLEVLENKRTRFFEPGPTFTPDHLALWPVHMFQVQRGRLVPIKSPKVALPDKSKSIKQTSGTEM